MKRKDGCRQKDTRDMREAKRLKGLEGGVKGSGRERSGEGDY